MNFKRRDFLQSLGGLGVGMGLSPLAMFINSVARAQVQNVLSTEAGINPRRMLFIQLSGAPNRWAWDQFLNPNGETLIPNGSVATHMTGGSRLDTLAYSTISHHSPQLGGNMQVPYLWQFDVPKAGGGNRAMSELLNYMLQIRGITTQDPGHSGSQAKQLTLAGSLASLGGTVADYSSATIPSIGVGVQELKFKAQKGSSLVTLEPFGGNLLQLLLGPFIDSAGATHNSKIESVQTLIDRSLASLDNQLKNYSPNLAKDRKNAEELIKEGVGDLNTSWNSLLIKYMDLVSRSLTTVATGVNNLPVGEVGSRNSGRYDFNTTGLYAANGDLYDMIQISDGTNPTVALAMAQEFALAEFALTNGYSYSIQAGLAGIFNCHVDVNGGGIDKGQFFNFDQHFSGVFVTTLMNNLFFMALSSCMLELIDQLKAKNMFKETLLYIGGEFNRKPRDNGSGTDHAWEAHSMSCFSEFIKGPIVVGNILNQSPDIGERTGDYPGTWGYGANVISNSVPANSGHLLSSVCQLLRVPNINPNTDPLISVVDDEVESLIGPPKMEDIA